MGGDFNVPLSLQLDSNGSKTEKRDVVTKICELMLDFNLIDIWRLIGTQIKSATRGNKINLIGPTSARLYRLISDDFQDDVDNTQRPLVHYIH